MQQPCQDAVRLSRRHARAMALLGTDAESRLVQVLQRQHEAARSAHAAACPRCALPAPDCPTCRADLSRRAHAFSCPRNPGRWAGLLRAATRTASRVAPPIPAAAALPERPAVRTAWEILGVERDAPLDVVRAAYFAKAKAYHPDRFAALGPDFRELAESRMREINAAYDALKDYPAPRR